MNICFICGKKTESKPLCTACLNNPFRIEDYRNKLAIIRNLKELKKTYGKKYPEIKDLNSSAFWNKRLNENKNLKLQDCMTKERIKTVFKFIRKNARRILDIGVGYGFIEELLMKDKNIEIYANDISPIAIKNVKKRFNGNFSVGSIYNLNYENNFFDQVLLLEVLEHIPPSKTFLILRNIKRLLKKKGEIIISVPLNENLEKMKININGHVRTYTKELLESELFLMGFKVMKCKQLYAFQKYYYFKKLLTFFFTNRWKPNNIIVLAKKI